MHVRMRAATMCYCPEFQRVNGGGNLMNEHNGNIS